MGDLLANSPQNERRTTLVRRPDARRDGVGVRTIALALVVALTFAGASGAGAEDRMPGLDEQVQEIKSDVLAIATELQQLEEKLLYPSETQVSVFLSLEEADGIELDSVRIEIDGEPVARHVYSFKELEALRRGGVQRVYTGNVPTGKHSLEVAMAGTLAGDTPFEETGSFSFEKAVAPKAVGLTLAGDAPRGARIQLGGL
jgi:hypothetical protein